MTVETPLYTIHRFQTSSGTAPVVTMALFSPYEDALMPQMQLQEYIRLDCEATSTASITQES